MKERPIIFSGESVRAILDGRKTQTRRVFKFRCAPYGQHQEHFEWRQVVQIPDTFEWIFWDHFFTDHEEFTQKAYKPGDGVKCPYGVPGDRLWVRETWAKILEREWDWESEELSEVPFHYEYRADLVAGSTDYPGSWPSCEACGNPEAPKWKPSIHMPRLASRINLEITKIRVERLLDISDDDALAEGVTKEQVDKDYYNGPNPIGAYLDLWDSLNAKRGLPSIANPWVFVIEFRRIDS